MEYRKKKMGWTSQDLAALEQEWKERREELRTQRRKNPSGPIPPLEDLVVYVRSSDGVHEPWGIQNRARKQGRAEDPEAGRGSALPETIEVGTLRLPFPDGTVLSVDNVRSAILAWQEEMGNGKGGVWIHLGNTGAIPPAAPTVEEMAAARIAVETQDVDEESGMVSTACMLFHGSKLVRTMEGVEDALSPINKDEYAITTKEWLSPFDCVFHRYSCTFEGSDPVEIGRTVGERYSVDRDRLEVENKLVESGVKASLTSGSFDYYFHADGGNASTVFLECLKEMCQPRRAANKLNGDETCNFVVRVSTEDIRLLSFLLYCGRSGYAVFGVPVERYLACAPERGGEFSYRCRADKEASEAALARAVRACPQFHTAASLQRSLEPLRSRTPIIQSRILGSLLNREIKRRAASGGSRGAEFDREFDALYELCHRSAEETWGERRQALADEGHLTVRWRRELEMYRLIKSKHEDAQYQFTCDWLEPQSLDVYIPTLKVGVEYQGAQHYRPVAFFGGQKGFENRKALDERKRSLCKEHGVNLVEWRHDKQLSAEGLEQAIRSASEGKLVIEAEFEQQSLF